MGWFGEGWRSRCGTTGLDSGWGAEPLKSPVSPEGSSGGPESYGGGWDKRCKRVLGKSGFCLLGDCDFLGNDSS